MRKLLAASLISLTASGCANMSAPTQHFTSQCPAESRSTCLLEKMLVEYSTYAEGAKRSQTVTDTVVLSSAVVGVVGAATSSSSELYKSAGALSLSALGFSAYGNFKDQRRITLDAAKRLDRAKSCLIRLEGHKAKQSEFQAFVSEQNGKADQVRNAPGTNFTTAYEKLRAYEVRVQRATEAETILREYDSDIVSLLLALQDSVEQLITKDSFDLQKAVLVITQKQQNTESEFTKAASQPDLSTQIIDDYNCVVTELAGKNAS